MSVVRSKVPFGKLDVARPKQRGTVRAGLRDVFELAHWMTGGMAPEAADEWGHWLQSFWTVVEETVPDTVRYAPEPTKKRKAK
jgi:hypothetical protein